MKPESMAQKPKVIGIYGLPGCGKTFVKEMLRQKHGERRTAFYDGSDKIEALVPGGLDAFKRLSNEEKYAYREQAITQIGEECAESGKNGLVTGHCMFWTEGQQAGDWVVTDADWKTYSHIIYLDVPPEIIAQRRQDDQRKRIPTSVDHLRDWQKMEVHRLREACYDHGVLLSVLSTAAGAHGLADPHGHNDHRLVALTSKLVLNNFTKEDEHTKALLADKMADLVIDQPGLDTMLVIDGDRTLTAEDTGPMFWSLVAGKSMSAKPDDPLKTLFQSPLGYTYTAFHQATLLYEDAAYRLGEGAFDGFCDEVASAVTTRPEFLSLIKVAMACDGIGVIVLTCGLSQIWEKVVEKAGLSSTVKVIGTGRLGCDLVVTPSVKGLLVDYLRTHHKLQVWAFGDSPVDLDMLRAANQSIVVVGEKSGRSKTMDEELTKAIEAGQLKAFQMVLPPTAPPRLDLDRLPLISPAEVEAKIGSPSLMPTLQHATNKSATKLLMAQTRNAANRGPPLQDAHRQVGRYLALEYLTEIIGLEPYDIPHVQGGGKTTQAHRLLHEDNALIVALMRGGLPMAEGVNEIFPFAGIVHAKNPADLTQPHLADRSVVILVDGVINNGDTVKAFVQHIRGLQSTLPIVVVADVVQAKSVSHNGPVWALARETGDLKVVALRLSDNKFTGKGTTDTGNRLFNTTHLSK